MPLTGGHGIKLVAGRCGQGGRVESWALRGRHDAYRALSGCLGARFCAGHVSAINARRRGMSWQGIKQPHMCDAMQRLSLSLSAECRSFTLFFSSQGKRAPCFTGEQELRVPAHERANSCAI